MNRRPSCEKYGPASVVLPSSNGVVTPVAGSTVTIRPSGVPMTRAPFLAMPNGGGTLAVREPT